MNRQEDSTNRFIPLSRCLVHKLREGGTLEASNALSIEDALEDLILSDPDIGGEIEKLTGNIRSTKIDPEKSYIPVWRAMVRPLVTVFLTLSFVAFLTIWIFSSIWLDKPDDVVKSLKEIFPVFLGIYGSVIGFWFGEHTAERAQEKQAQIESSRAERPGRSSHDFATANDKFPR